MAKQANRQIVSSHDTGTRLSSAAQWLNEYPPDAEILILSPTREAGDEFVRHAALSTGARFGLTRITLNQIASVLAAPGLAHTGVAPASGLVLAAVAARSVHLLLAEEKLAYFSEVATRPGFPTAAARTLEELRMNGADHAQLEVLPRGGSNLAALAERTERELSAAHLADRAALFRAAIEAVEQSQTTNARF